MLIVRVQNLQALLDVSSQSPSEPTVRTPGYGRGSVGVGVDMLSRGERDETLFNVDYIAF